MAGIEFSRSARRPAPVVEDALLQWASGLTTTERSIYAGWMVEAGKHDDLDIAMHEAECFPQVTIKHGNGNVVTHWAIETANLFVVAEGVQSISEMKRTGDRFGIAFGWRTLDGGRRQSVLKLRAFLPELLRVRYTEPLTLTVKSTVTGDIISALMRQLAVLDAVDVFRAQDKKPALNPPLYACSLPIGPGADTPRGSGSTVKTITPPVAQIDDVVSRDHVKAHWIRREWLALVEDCMDETIRWSVEESKRIASGGQVEAYQEA